MIEDCPDCGTHIGTPSGFHGGGTTGTTMHTHRDCPGCGRPLIWFNDETRELKPGWRVDDAEERRQKLKDDS